MIKKVMFFIAQIAIQFMLKLLNDRNECIKDLFLRIIPKPIRIENKSKKVKMILKNDFFYTFD